MTIFAPGRRARVGAAAALVVASVVAAPNAGAQDKQSCADSAERGQTERHAGDLVSARASFIRCMSDRCPEAVRQDCTRWLDEVEAELPTISIHAKDARGRDVIGARVIVDGAPVAERLTGGVVHVNPGEHRLRLETPSGVSTEQRILVATGQKARVVELRFDADLDADGRSDGASGATAPTSQATRGETAGGGSSLVLPLVLGAAGVVGLGVGTYLELAGQSEYRDLRDGCGRAGTCSPDDVDANRTKLHVAAPVSLVVGAALLVAGGVLLVRALGSRDGGALSPHALVERVRATKALTSYRAFAF